MRTTLVVAGTVGAVITFAALFLPRMRDLERGRTDRPRLSGPLRPSEANVR